MTLDAYIKRYLSKSQYARESVLSIYAVLWASYGLSGQPHGQYVLRWTGLDEHQATFFLGGIILCFGLHAVGINANGSWRWSPLFRCAGLIGFVAAFGFMTVSGFGTSAFITYAFITAVYAFVCKGACNDSFDAIRGGHGHHSH